MYDNVNSRHMCGACGALWSGGHTCFKELELVKPEPHIMDIESLIQMAKISTDLADARRDLDKLTKERDDAVNKCIRLQADLDHLKRTRDAEIAKAVEISEQDHASAKADMRKEIARLKAIIEVL